MNIIDKKVFVENLTIPEKGVNIPQNEFNKIIYIDSHKCNVSIKGNSIKAKKYDYIVIEKDNHIRIKTDEESGEKCNIVVIYIHSEYVRELSSNDCNLEQCFIEAKNTEVRLVRASSEVYMLIKALTRRLIFYEKMQGFGRNEILKSTLVILLAIANRGYIESKLNKKRAHRKLDIIDEIFIYINNHISEEITLNDLEKEFFISKFYLSKIFKEVTNMTIHSCILKRKLSYSKELIEQNMPIVEVYSKSGFGDYTHFFRAFKKEFGMTPKEYYRKSKLCMDGSGICDK